MRTVDRFHQRLRPGLVLAAVVGALMSTCAVSAFADPVDLQVVNRDTGQPLRIWRHDGRAYVAGQPGARYGLRVTNHTGGRVLVVMSVDGVNILTGETAGYDQRGYVFGAHETYDINGWRKSTTQIAAFAFAALPQSYAARTGRPADVGVIGIAAFEERPPVQVEPAPPASGRVWDRARPPMFPPKADAPPPPPAEIAPAPAMRAGPTPPSPSSGSFAQARREDKLGTAHGAREWSVSDEVDFERATIRPLTVRQIEYDTRDNLVAGGVIPSWQADARPPRPFPSHGADPNYVPDPPRP